jgi:GDP-L-fucose synthase
LQLQDKKVAVTGGAGFVGKHLVELLVGAGAAVLVLDDMSRGSNIVKGAKYMRADAGSETACLKAFEDTDIVFNLAAWVAGVIYNQRHHAEMFEKNMRLLTTPVLAAEARGVRTFVQVSSVCVYSPAHNSPAIEEFGHMGVPVQANIGYSWAKRMGEHMLSWSTIPHRAIVRPSNIYGPHDYFDERAHVIPALIKKATNDEVVKLHGSGEEIREFLYVEDAANGMLHAGLNAPEGVNSYNLGTGGKTSVAMRDLALLICHLCGYPDKSVVTEPHLDGGDSERYSHIGRAQAELGWDWTVDLTDGLRRTIEWYRNEQGIQTGSHH